MVCVACLADLYFKLFVFHSLCAPCSGAPQQNCHLCRLVIISPHRKSLIFIDNHMISSEIWNRSAQVNFSPAHRQVALENFMNADLFQTVWGKSCDNLLIIYKQKYECFPL